MYTTHCTSSFVMVNDVVFSHNGPYDGYSWQYRCGLRTAASSHKFPT